MMKNSNRLTAYAVCINNADYPASLERHKISASSQTKTRQRMAICESSMKAAKITSNPRIALFRFNFHPRWKNRLKWPRNLWQDGADLLAEVKTVTGKKGD